MTKNYLARWAHAAWIRALKTFANTAVSTIGTTAVMSEVDWIMVISTSMLAAVLSLLTSVSSLPEVNDNGTNNTHEE